jgi:hypothetical protein
VFKDLASWVSIGISVLLIVVLWFLILGCAAVLIGLFLGVVVHVIGFVAKV